MGWWGKYYYGKLTMQDVRKYIEEDTGLTVKSLKFGYAICVYDTKAFEKAKTPQPDLLNYIMVVLWRKNSNEIMMKQIGEDMGPCELDIPMKYINAPCEAMATYKFSNDWRNKVREFHKKRKENVKRMKSFKEGDIFTTKSNREFKFISLYKNNTCLGRCNGVTYRVNPNSIV